MEAEGEVVSTPASPPPAAPAGAAQLFDGEDAGATEVKPNGEAGPAPPVEAKPESVPKGVQKRIDRAVRDKYEAQARAKVLEERLAAIEARQQQPAKATDTAMPKIEQFSSFDEYVEAKASYIARQQIEQTLTEREQRQMAVRAQSERATVAEKWNAKVASATAEMPDFEDVITSSDVPMTEAMQQAIMESDLGPKLAYHLANNPEEARKIAAMSPVGAIRALGRIEERLSKPADKVTTSAPEPIKPTGASARVEKDPSDMSQKEFEKWRKSVIAKR